jgi:hypothetical protein
MRFIRLEDGMWVNLDYVESVRIAEKQGIEIRVDMADGAVYNWKSFDDIESAQDWLDENMEWSQ